MTEESESILAHLVLRFSDRPEPVATEGLGHLLATSGVCRTAIVGMLGRLGINVPDDLSYQSEVVDPEAEGRPDIVGLDAQRVRRLVIEGKFWAPLTDRQPVSYLRSLPEKSTLLIIAPSRRHSTLWAELVHRCTLAGLDLAETADGERVAWIGGQAWLVLMSWSDLLQTLQSGMIVAGDQRRAADVQQLQSLCDCMDSEAFIPLTKSELSHPSPRRVYQFIDVVDALAEYAREHGVLSSYSADGKKLNAARTKYRYYRYMSAGSLQVAILCAFDWWAQLRDTPLWLEVAIVERDTALRTLEVERPPRVYYVGWQGRPVIPLFLPIHVEKETVLKGLLDQVREILGMARRPTAGVDGETSWGHEDGTGESEP